MDAVVARCFITASGDILIGSVSIHQLGLARIRSMLACVLQDDVLLAGSIADNISFFDSQIDFKNMQQCATSAAIATDIEAMPIAEKQSASADRVITIADGKVIG